MWYRLDTVLSNVITTREYMGNRHFLYCLSIMIPNLNLAVRLFLTMRFFTIINVYFSYKHSTIIN